MRSSLILFSLLASEISLKAFTVMNNNDFDLDLVQFEKFRVDPPTRFSRVKGMTHDADAFSSR